MDILNSTIVQLREMLKKKEVSSVELTGYYLDRIGKYNGEILAYLRTTDDHAMEMAREADERISRGEDAPLLGIPLGMKDILCTKGIETTCASNILKGFVPPYDATVIRKLKEAGFVHLGRLNMDEFAMGSSTENSAFQTTANPWDTSRIPGGSSGGSAAAVASGLCVGALGTDTGGSIRQPASLCGVIGMKPTYGRVSRYGLIAFASSLDQIGPFSRTVSDCATMLGVIAGHDPLDSTSIPEPVPDYQSFLGRDIKGKGSAYPVNTSLSMEEDVRKNYEENLQLLKDQGQNSSTYRFPIHVTPWPPIHHLHRRGFVEPCALRRRQYGLREEGKDIIDMYKKTRFAGFGKEVKRRIILGTYVLSSGYYDAYYRKAGKVRTLIRRDFDAAFASCDLIVTPVSPTTAFKVGERLEDPLTMYLSDIFTIPVNLAGLPGISIPGGFERKGLPIGLQIIGKPLDEGRMLQAAHVFESVKKMPTIPERYR